MNENIKEELLNGYEVAYINGASIKNSSSKPEFISNDPLEGRKVITSIEDELMKCDKFQISVAFITLGGVTPLLQILKELEKKNIPGEILTTNYLEFTQPEALERLNNLKNITLKMFDCNAANIGFHTCFQKVNL